MKTYQEAEVFVNQQFYEGTYDSNVKLRISDIVDAKLEADNAAKDPDYYGHRDGVLHTSSLYGCMRGLVHQAIGSPKTSPPDSRKLGVFKAGNLFEDFIVDSLGSIVLNRQTEYLYKHKNLVVTGRDDGLLFHDEQYRLLEAKSVNSNAFWYRHREGILVQWHNQLQLMTYLWFRRILPRVVRVQKDGGEIEEVYTNMTNEEVLVHKPGYTIVLPDAEKPDWSQLGGIFSYISKDDCTVESAPVKFNQNIIDEIIIPVLDEVDKSYKTLVDSGLLQNLKNAEGDEAKAKAQEEINEFIRKTVPAPDLAIYVEGKKQWQTNWICKYNDYAELCYGSGWVLEAGDLVKRKNKELKESAFAATMNAVNGNNNG